MYDCMYRCWPPGECRYDVCPPGDCRCDVCCTGVVHQFDEMHLLPEPLFTLPTDNVHMMSIESTHDGRIFMSGKDGCLYELVYQVSVSLCLARTVVYKVCVCLRLIRTVVYEIVHKV